MHRSILGAACAALFATAVPLAAVEPRDILPKGAAYDPAVPTPERHFGFPVGSRHLYHHELVGYLNALDEGSDRVTLREYARSYGGRPLVMLTITSPENHRRLEEIRARHLRLADPERSSEVDVADLPAVLNMGYGVHGNEPSASNVAPLVAYHLAAGTGAEHERLLREVVVLLDPCLNPDGFDRFAHWANDHRGAAANPDPVHREHREAWPGGRTNYYWFDLNRDWLPLVHPESRGRLQVYHAWKPNVVLDFHEMSTDATYFFQPGEPKRNHPLTPRRTVELTEAFARSHARALDRIGSLYFTGERFDDFYAGKGSTYPDLHGAVGILFEQASARGQVQESPHGKVTFPFTIRNQFQTSLSSLRTTLELRTELLEHKRAFYRDSNGLADSGREKGYVVAAPGDPVRLHQFLDVLRLHDIRAYRLGADLVAGGKRFRKGEAFVIPAAQPEARFLRALFETRTEFEQSIFYDVSAWSLPLAYNLRFAALDRPPSGAVLGEPFDPEAFPGREPTFGDEDLAYVIDWRSHAAPAALHRLLAAGVKVRVATETLRCGTEDGDTDFGYGTLMVPLGIQPEKRGKVVEILRQAAREGVAVHPLRSGLTPGGIDLGSSAFAAVPEAKVLLVTGEGVSASEAGEVWHLLDRRVGMPVTLVDAHRLGGVKLDDYTVVVLVSGTYATMPAAAAEGLKEFVSGGGTLVAIGTAVNWVNARKIVPVRFREEKKEQQPDRPSLEKRRPYAAARDDAALRSIPGSIFKARVDPSHPIGYGFDGDEPLPVFRNNRVILELSENAYSTPVAYDREPLLGGYVSEENLKRLAGSAGAVVVPSGSGRVILMADNPNFRGYWYGTNRLFLNAIFFGPLTRVPSAGEE